MDDIHIWIEDIADMDAGFYSVAVTNANGCTTSLDSIEVRDETVGTSLIPRLDVRVYPNPAKDIVHFDVADVNEYLIQLKGIDGRIVDTWANKKTIDVSMFTPGIYVLHVISVDKQFTARLVIAK